MTALGDPAVATVGELIAEPIAVDHPLVMPPGVYFGLPEDKYHAALALSASSIKHLRVSPLDYWARSALNPDREDEETDAKLIGKAYHKRIVEGREAFWRCYAAELDPGDYPGVARTNDDLKAVCAERGLKVGGTKADLIARLVAHDPALSGIIWESLVSVHASEHQGKELLPRDLIHKIELAAAHIEKHPMLAKAFSGGQPEVSVFWVDRETGVPCKSRIDYLKATAIVDLKSFSNPLGKPIDVAVRHAIATNLYHVQAAMYWRAVREAVAMIKLGLVFGDVPTEFLSALTSANEDDRRFFFLFQATGVAPVARGYVLPRGTVFGIGDHIVASALLTFANCWETFGPAPWVDMTDVQTFDDVTFPAWIGE